MPVKTYGKRKRPIAAIEQPVTADSREAIERAQRLCDALTDEELAKLEGLDTLLEAQSILADIDNAAEVDAAILSIKQLSFEGEELDRIDDMILNLSERAKQMLTELDTLEHLREEHQEFRRYMAEDAYGEILEDFEAGYYSNVWSEAELFLGHFLESEYILEVRELVGSALVEYAREEFEKGDPDYAMYLIEELRGSYSDVSAETMQRADALEADILQEQRDAVVQLYNEGDMEGAINAGESFLSMFAESDFAEEVRELITSAEEAIEQTDYDAVVSLYDEEDYEGVITAGKQFRREYPSGVYYNDALELMAHSQLAIARRHSDNEEYYQAEKELEPFEKDYKDTDTAEEATELLEWLEARKGSEPENGYKLYNELDSGYGELTIKGGSNPAVVKVESDNGYSMMFYVRANETATVNLRDGSFMLKYATGTTWYGGGDLFGPRTKYSLADEVLTYETTYSGNSVYYSTYEVTLYSVLGGNLETESIDADEF